MDPTSLTFLGAGTGVLLLWSALANQNPVDVLRAAFVKDHPIRPLWTGDKRQGVVVLDTPNQDAVGAIRDAGAFRGPTGGLRLSELFYDPRGGYKNGQSIGPIGGHGGHVHAAVISGHHWSEVVGYLKSRGVTVSKVGSTTGGVHTPTSKHYKAEAVDFPGHAGAGPDPELDRIWDALVPLARY